MSMVEHNGDLATTVQPLDIAAYLRAAGWGEARTVADGAGMVWQRDASKRGLQILLPLDPTYDDYPERMRMALQRLATVEGRSIAALVTDLTMASADIIRIRAIHPTLTDGTIAIDEGVSLIEHARDLLLAAACATVERRPIFQTRKPTQAMEYLRNRVRLGQTERGSYVVTVISRLPPALSPADSGMLFSDPVDPFERKATRMLAGALEATRQAAQRAVMQGEVSPFNEAVASGFSVNLSDALAGIYEGSSAVQVDFSWSPSREVPAQLPRRVLLPAQLMPAVKEAARLFREASPIEDVEIEGAVTTLHRPEPAEMGNVTVLAFLDKQPRKITLQLGGAEYDLAIQAHRAGFPVRCTGELVKEGRGYQLRHPRGFSIEPLE